MQLIAVIVVGQHSHFLLGIRFTVVTDCSVVTYLGSRRDIKPQAKPWLDLLCEYYYSFRHHSGSRIAYVDVLSLAPVEQCELNTALELNLRALRSIESKVNSTVPIEDKVSVIQAQYSEKQSLRNILLQKNKQTYNSRSNITCF